MIPVLSAQQTSFYTKNHYLELEGLLTEGECDAFFPLMEEKPGRDLWRQNHILKEFLLSRRMSKLALHLTAKAAVQLACDQWLSPDFFKTGNLIKLKELFSIQGIRCLILIQFQPGKVEKPAKASPLGLFPFPQKQGNALIVNGDLLMSWPALCSNIGLYAVAYSVPPSIYIQNPKDPAPFFLKQFGYGYGDLLSNETHPIIMKS